MGKDIKSFFLNQANKLGKINLDFVVEQKLDIHFWPRQ